MILQSYSPIDGKLIKSPVNLLNFGNVAQGRHCDRALVLRAFLDNEVTISDLTLYLESKGGWVNANLGYYLNSSFEENVIPGGEKLNQNHFIEVPNAQSGSPNGIPVGWLTDKSQYIWLDIDIPTDQVGVSEINYRFIFNYT